MSSHPPSPCAAALRVGAHTSAAGGVDQALYEAQSIGATVTQLFTANQRRWQSKPFEAEQLLRWRQAQERTGIFEVMSHASYLINLAAPDPENLAKSLQGMRLEIERCRLLGVRWINFHPGSSVDGQEQEGLDRIVASLRTLKELCSDDAFELLFEATAGQGTQLGYRFEQLGYLIDQLQGELPIGVCIDTCHIFAAGYDLHAAGGWSKTLEAFDRCIGLRFLKALHLNDSMRQLGKRVDRHAALGEGEIGWSCFEAIVKDPRSRCLPMFLETPVGVEGWRREIQTLQKLALQGRS